MCLENQSLRSQANHHWLTKLFVCVCACVCACVCVYACQDNCFQGAPDCLTVVSSTLQYLLWALCPKGNILSLVCVTCCLKHAAACGPHTHDHITCSHAKCEQISARSHGHFSPVTHHFPRHSFILCARLNGGLFLRSSTGVCRNVSAALQAGYQPDEARSGGD